MAKQTRSRTPKQLKLKDAKKLDQIERLRADGDFDEALDRILLFTRANPDLVEGWELLLEVAVTAQNDYLAWKANRQLVLLEPNDPLHRYNAAAASASLGNPFSTMKHVRYYLEHFPKGAHARQIGEMEKALTPVWEKILREDEMARMAAHPDDLSLFEEGQVLVSSGEIAEGRRLSQEAARMFPGAPAPLNNISLSYVLEGKLAKALEITQQVLEQHPQNLHARCNFVQLLTRLGRDAEAQAMLEPMRNETPENLDHWGKLMETFAIAGDDAAVVSVYERARKNVGRDADKMLGAHSHHMAAVSHARLGNTREAKRLWNRALSQSPTMTIAEDNLDDIALPVGERNGAWHFPFQQWITRDWIPRLERILRENAHRSADRLRREYERAFATTPELKVALSILLDRGDPIGRKIALGVASHYPLPGLVEFALGQHGTDSDRMEAGRSAVEHGLLDASQPVVLYVKGKPIESFLLSYEIHSEQEESGLPEQAQEYLEAAHEALQQRKAEEALEWIEMGLELVPDEKTLLNYKAAAFGLLKRDAEERAVIEHTVALYPDYLFARCAMAKLCAQEKRFDEAEEWLKPIRTRTRFHHSEFKAFAITQAELLRARGEKEGAKSWMQMWQQMELEQLAMDDDDEEDL